MVLNEVETALPQTDAEIDTGNDEEDGADNDDEDVGNVPHHEVEIDLGGEFRAVEVELAGTAADADNAIVEGYHDDGTDHILEQLEGTEGLHLVEALCGMGVAAENLHIRAPESGGHDTCHNAGADDGRNEEINEEGDDVLLGEVPCFTVDVGD